VSSRQWLMVVRIFRKEPAGHVEDQDNRPACTDTICIRTGSANAFSECPVRPIGY
jgi:hypothetical protein